MAEIKKYHQAITNSGTRVAALSVDSPGQSLALKKEMELPFDLLCDTDKHIVNRYSLLNPHEHGGIAYPAIFLIKSTGLIGYRSLDRTAQRVNLAEVLDYLVELGRNPDYILNSNSRKQVIVPSFSTLRQMARNVAKRGNRADWKHFIGYPAFILKYLSGIARRPNEKK